MIRAVDAPARPLQARLLARQLVGGDRRRRLRGRVFGKSGYVNNVSSLSGYVHARDGEWYAFSILMNDVPSGTNHRAKEIHEKIVEAIDGSVASVAAGE